jgi:hypothetical protein
VWTGARGRADKQGETTMQRRKFLIGAGSLAAAGAAGLGTGAFTSVSAERTVTVNVADDDDALLRLTQDGTGPNSQYANISNGQVGIDLDNSDTTNGGSGVNKNAKTFIRDIFRIQNQGTQPAFVYVDPDSVTPEGAKTFLPASDIYIDPQATNRPNDDIEPDQNFADQGISMTGIYGVHDPTAGFEDRDPSSSTDLKGEDLTLGVGEWMSFGLTVKTTEDANFTDLSVSMDLVADADLAADLS